MPRDTGTTNIQQQQNLQLLMSRTLHNKSTQETAREAPGPACAWPALRPHRARTRQLHTSTAHFIGSKARSYPVTQTGELMVLRTSFRREL